MIRTDGVTVSFGDATVLDGVDFRARRGELVGLVGPNGAGKTTLLRTVNGILEPDAGAVFLDGEPVSGHSSKELSRRVATVPQNSHVGFAFTAEQVVEMGRTPHRSRLDWTDDERPVERAMKQTETFGLRDRRVDDLSGGERQLVLLARALAQDAPVLVLDEPTASLDINHQVRVLETVRELVDGGRTALAAIHDLDLAARYCDRLLLLHEGTIRAAGRPDAVLSDPTLEEAFGTSTAVSYNPATGTPTVAAVADRGSPSAHVHVVGTGPPAARAVGDLWRAGFEVTLGVVSESDVAADAARRLGVECVTAAPLEVPDDGTVRAAIARIENADVVVTAGDPSEHALAAAVDDHDRVVAVGAGSDVSPGDAEAEDRVGPDEAEAAVERALAGREAAADD